MNLDTIITVDTITDLIQLSVLWDREGFEFMWIEDGRKTKVQDLDLVGKIRVIRFNNGLHLYEEKGKRKGENGNE